jgi:hypothetical protein
LNRIVTSKKERSVMKAKLKYYDLSVSLYVSEVEAESAAQAKKIVEENLEYRLHPFHDYFEITTENIEIEHKGREVPPKEWDDDDEDDEEEEAFADAQT